MDIDAIKRSAKCEMEQGVYCVRSPLFERVLGASAIEGEAWMRFYELLEEYCTAHVDGTLVERHRAAVVLGTNGGASKTAAKRAASALNGKKGGRPKKISG